MNIATFALWGRNGNSSRQIGLNPEDISTVEGPLGHHPPACQIMTKRKAIYVVRGTYEEVLSTLDAAQERGR